LKKSELGERLHPRHFRALCHRYCEVSGRRAVLGGVLVIVAGAELHDTLDMNVQGFQQLMDSALRPRS